MSISSINSQSALMNTLNQTKGSNKASDQKDMFMKLLVAQLKNQDPLQPQDGAQFVAQLAQFNSLEQLTGMRQSIDQLVATMNNSKTVDTNE